MQLSPKTPSIFYNLFQDKSKNEPVHNILQFKQFLEQKSKIRHIKMLIDKPPTEQQFYTIQAKSAHRSQQRKISQINDSQLTVVSVRKQPQPQSNMHTIELSPHLNTISTPPKTKQKKKLNYLLSNRTTEHVKLPQTSKNLNYKFKVYSQEYRNNNSYVKERKRFESCLDEKLRRQIEEKQKILQERIEEYKIDLKKNLDRKQLLPVSEMIEEKLSKRGRQRRLNNLLCNK